MRRCASLAKQPCYAYKAISSYDQKLWGKLLLKNWQPPADNTHTYMRKPTMHSVFLGRVLGSQQCGFMTGSA